MTDEEISPLEAPKKPGSTRAKKPAMPPTEIPAVAAEKAAGNEWQEALPPPLPALPAAAAAPPSAPPPPVIPAGEKKKKTWLIVLIVALLLLLCCCVLVVALFLTSMPAIEEFFSDLQLFVPRWVA